MKHKLESIYVYGYNFIFYWNADAVYTAGYYLSGVRDLGLSGI